MIIIQKHMYFSTTQVENDSLELGDRVATALYDEKRLGGSRVMYFWRAEAWNH